MDTENTQGQHKRQYDWLKGYQFVKGQSGNPGGMKKGTKSMKTFAREYLMALPDEERIAFMDTLPSDFIWKMAEGMPDTKGDMNIAGTLTIQVSESIAKKNADETQKP